MSHYLRLLALFVIGIANALPMPLRGSTLSVWLTEAGMTKQMIGYLALLNIPFSLKLLWIPIIDQLSFPFFKSQRKGWTIFSILGIALVIFGFSFAQPDSGHLILIVCLLALSLFAGCLYVSGLYYELESLDESMYSMGSAAITIGYRIGLLCAGALALSLAHLWGWDWMFLVLAVGLSLSAMIILLQPEPHKSASIISEKREQFSKYPSRFRACLHEILLQPATLLYKRSDWTSILCFIIAFKFGDQLIMHMTGPFYLFLGFDKAEIAFAAKALGMASTIMGAFVAGIFFKKVHTLRTLAIVGFVHACTLFGYYLMSLASKSMINLYALTIIENLTGGMAMTIFIVYLWSLSERRYAVQFALLWSFFSLKADLLSCCGSLLAAYVDWSMFFGIVVAVNLVVALGIYLFLPDKVESMTVGVPTN